MVTRRGIGLMFTLVLLMAFSSSAQQLYIANEPQKSLQLLNLNTHPRSSVPVYGRGQAGRLDPELGGPTHLLDSSLGQVDLYDPSTDQNTTCERREVCSRFGNRTGRQTMLIAIYSPGGSSASICHGGEDRAGQEPRELRWHRLRSVWKPLRSSQSQHHHPNRPVAGTILNTLSSSPITESTGDG